MPRPDPSRTRAGSLVASPVAGVVALMFVVAFAAPAARGGVSKVFGQSLTTAVATGMSRLGLGLAALLLVLSLVVAIVRPTQVGRLPVTAVAVITMQAAAVALGVIVAVGHTPLSYIVGNGQYLAAYVIAVGVAVTTTPAQGIALLGALRWATTLPAIWTVLAFALVGFTRTPADTRLIQDGAAFTIVASMLWFARAFTTRSRGAAAMTVLCMATPVIGGLRGNQIGLALAVLVMLLVLTRGPVRLFSILGLTAVTALAPTLSSLVVSLQSRITGRAADALNRSTGYREAMSDDLLGAWRQSPWFGHGLGYVPYVTGRRSLDEISRPYIVELSYHNLFVKLGLIGAALVLVSIGIVLFMGTRTVATVQDPVRRTDAAALTASTVGLLAVGAVNPLLESVYLHLVLGLCVAVWFPQWVSAGSGGDSVSGPRNGPGTGRPLRTTNARSIR